MTMKLSKDIYEVYLTRNKLISGGGVRPHWLAGGRNFWYADGAPYNTVIYQVDVLSGEKKPLFDITTLRAAIADATGYEPPYKGLPFDSIELVKGDKAEFVLEGDRWRVDLVTYKLQRYAIMKKLLPLFILFALSFAATAQEKEKPAVDPNGTIHVPDFELSESSFLSEETRAMLKYNRDTVTPEWQHVSKNCPDISGSSRKDSVRIRQCRTEEFYKTTLYRGMVKRYDIEIETGVFNGVDVEIFTPAAGIKASNKNKVLINLHGGGFVGGAGIVSRMESIPIASVGQIKVISIDYRMATEHSFPSASEDIEAVYTELLKHYKSENIGIYGGGAGAMLTAQSIAWFFDKGLPLPAAAGLFCGGAGTKNDFSGDSAAIVGALMGFDSSAAQYIKSSDYFKGVEDNNPLAYPQSSPKTLSRFPPSLLISSTRDLALSTVVKTHIDLRRLDVEAELYVWEGLGHCFHYYPDTPESREVYDVIVKFFDQHWNK